MPAMDTLVDAFSGAGFQAHWDSITGSPSINGSGQAVIPQNAILGTTSVWTAPLTLYVRVLSVTTTCKLRITANNGNWCEISREPGTFTNFSFRRFNNGSTNASNTSYSSTTHAWWRIQQSGSNIQIHTSTNGSSWTQRASWSWNTSWSTCKVEFINTGSGNFIIDGVNTTDLSLPDPVGGTDYEETALTLSASVNFESPTVTRTTFTTGVALPISPTLGALSVVRDSPTTGTALSTSVSLGPPSTTQDYASTGLTLSAETALDDPSTTLHALSSGQNLATEAALLDPEVIFQAESAGQTLSTGVSAEEPATALHASIESPSLDVEADSTTPETSRGAVTDAEALTLTPSVDSPEVSASLSTGVDGLESVVEVSPQVVQDAQDTAESLNVGLSTENPSTQHAASGAANSQSTFVYFSAPSVQVHSKVVVPELSTGASLDPDTSLEAVSEGEELSTGASLDEPATSKRSSSEGLALATTIEAGPGSTETLSEADAPDNTVSMALGTPSVIHRAVSTTESLSLGVSNTPTDSLNAFSESESLETTPTLTEPESTRRQTAEADSLGLAASFDDSTITQQASSEADSLSASLSFPGVGTGGGILGVPVTLLTGMSLGTPEVLTSFSTSATDANLDLSYGLPEATARFFSTITLFATSITTGTPVLPAPLRRIPTFVTELPSLLTVTVLEDMSIVTAIPSMAAPATAIPSTLTVTSLPSMAAPATAIPDTATVTAIPSMAAPATAIPDPGIITELEE